MKYTLFVLQLLIASAALAQEISANSYNFTPDSTAEESCKDGRFVGPFRMEKSDSEGYYRFLFTDTNRELFLKKSKTANKYTMHVTCVSGCDVEVIAEANFDTNRFRYTREESGQWDIYCTGDIN